MGDQSALTHDDCAREGSVAPLLSLPCMMSSLTTLGRLRLLARSIHPGLAEPQPRLPGQTTPNFKSTRRSRTRPLSALPSEGFSS